MAGRRIEGGLRAALRASWGAIVRALRRWGGAVSGGRGGLGRRGEAAAVRYLRSRGLRILARNFRRRSGEIDIVALDGDVLVLVEVKSSTPASRGETVGRIDAAKLRRIRRAASELRRRAGGAFTRCRIDGVSVEFDRTGRLRPEGIRWYPDLAPVDPER